MKKTVIVGAVAIIAAGLAFWFVGRPMYRRHQEHRAVEQAGQFMAKGDTRNTSLSSRRALQINPRNMEACRIMAELSEMSRSPAALDWRRRIAETSPTTENKLKLAAAALRLQTPPFALTTQILQEVGPSVQNLSEYHVVAGELAVKLRHAEDAERQFETASRLEPTNQMFQLNVAALRIESTNAEVAAAARATLERLCGNPDLRPVALHWLISPAIQKNDWAKAEEYSSELIANPHAPLGDRLLHLNILRERKSAEAGDYMKLVKTQAGTNAVQAYDMSTWLISHGMADEALQWLTNLVTSIRREQPTPLALAECYFAKKDWIGLQSCLEGQKWGELDFLRFAYLSRAAEQLRQNLAMEAHWRSAVREAGERYGALTRLLALTRFWGRDRAHEELLWQLSQHFPRDRNGFFQELQRHFEATGNTSGLNKLAAARLSYDAHDFHAQNDFAGTALLLRLNLPRAHELAKEAYNAHPEEPVVAATYAYSLYVQGRTKLGLGVLDKVKPEIRERPPIALYYGVLLAAAGETNAAAPYLAAAQNSAMLPEEKALLVAVEK
jgi:predicted Zn-dependent protease